MKKLFGILCFAISCTAVAQHTEWEPCGQDKLMQQLETEYPGFRKTYDRNYLDLVHPKAQVQSRKTFIKDTTYWYDTVFVIPVVFHVLYNNSNENVHDSLLQNQLEELNEDFRRWNADTVNTRSYFKDRAGDARIQFVLATQDPSGNATTGIVRKYTSVTTFGNNSLSPTQTMKANSTGGNNAWNTQKYLNIWVCDISSPAYGDALLGYAYPPTGHPSWPSSSWISSPNQGVVVHYKVFGRGNPLSTGNLANSAEGKVAVHEVGHYLGLRHTWGDAYPASQGCNVDDYIDDTPNQYSKSANDCVLNRNSCSDPAPWPQMPDMVENYMDYSSAQCQNMFTKRQIQVMRNCIDVYRSDLPSERIITKYMRVKDTIVYNDLKLFVTDNQRIYVELRNADVQNFMKADLYNLLGQRVLKDAILNKNENYISTANMAPGYYYIHLKTGDNRIVRKEKLFISKM